MSKKKSALEEFKIKVLDGQYLMVITAQELLNLPDDENSLTNRALRELEAHVQKKNPEAKIVRDFVETKYGMYASFITARVRAL